METAETVVKDALQELLVQASEAPIEASEAQTAIRYMNRMMFEFDAQGITLGYTKVDNLGDPVTIPDGAYNGVVYNLAIRLASQYGAQVTASLTFAADSGIDAMRRIAVEVLPTQYPSTLPIGSGNEWDSETWPKFYPGEDESILNETDNYIQTESNTGDL